MPSPLTPLLASAKRCLELKDLEGAKRICLQSIQEEGSSDGAFHLLGQAHLGSGQFAEAEAAFRETAKLEPGFAPNWFNLGVIQLHQDKKDEAWHSFEEAVRLNPNFAEAHYNLGALADRRGNQALALAHFEKALQLQSNNPMLQYLVAARSNQAIPSQAPEQYLRWAFNEKVADRFDHHMVEVLEYNAPMKFGEFLDRWDPPPRLDVLDIGCGTGLCGRQAHPFARKLVGIDLSPAMLVKAEETGLYDILKSCDASDLSSVQEYGPFDVIVATDLFIYLGDIAASFQWIATLLKPGGYFFGTAESLEDERQDFVLHVTERYAHSASYLRRLAKNLALSEFQFEPITLRLEKGKPISGYIFVFKKDVQA